MENSHIDLAAKLGTSTLAGRPLGIQHLPTLLQIVLSFKAGDVVIWDCHNIDVLSASYVAATFVTLIRMVSTGSLDRHFLLKHIPPDSMDDVTLALEHSGVPALLLNDQGELTILGPLDPANAQTLALVQQRREVSARQLADADPSIGQTGWIKRLTTLADWGMIHRTRRGREFVYRPITTELQHG